MQARSTSRIPSAIFESDRRSLAAGMNSRQTQKLDQHYLRTVSEKGVCMKKHHVVLTILAIALTACASIPPAVFVDMSLSTAGPEKHVVTVERGSTMGADHAPLHVYVDEKLVAKLYGNQAINLYLPSGRYRIGVAMNGVGIFGHGEHGPDRAITVDVSASSNPILMASPIGGVMPIWKIEKSN